MIAFNKLKYIIEVLEELGLPEAEKDEMLLCLTENQRYIHTYFKHDVKQESHCIYHCMNHALSDGTEEFSNRCTHRHDGECYYCELLSKIMNAIESLLDRYKEALGDRKYEQYQLDVRNSYRKILAFKYHQIQRFVLN